MRRHRDGNLAGIILVNERADAEGAENRPDRDFRVDFRLNDDGELELKKIGESCWNTILQKPYPVLLEPIGICTGKTRHAHSRRKDQG